MIASPRLPDRAHEVRRDIRLLSVICFLHSMANAATLPIVPLFVVSLGGSLLTIGLVIAAAEFLPTLLALSAGAFIDRGGPKLPMQAGSVALLLGSLLRAAASDIPVLLAAQVLVGLANLLVFLAAQSHISLISRPQEQAQNFGAWSFVTSAGQVAGPLLGGVLASLVASGGDPLPGHRAVFAVTAALGTASLLAGWRLRPVPGRREIHLSPRHTLRAAAQLLDMPTVAMGAWTSLGLMLNSGVRRSFFPVYGASIGLNAAGIGSLMSAYSVASMAVRPAFGWAVRVWGSFRTLVAALSLCAGLAMVPLLDSLWALLAVMVVAGAGIGIGSPLTMVLAVEGADAHTRGLGLGIRQTANRVADFVSPAVYGAVAAAVGVASTFFIAAGFALGGLLVAVRIARRTPVVLRQPVAELPAVDTGAPAAPSPPDLD